MTNHENKSEPGFVTMTLPLAFQGVALWVGDGHPIIVDDRMSPLDLADLLPAPLQRAVTAARLRIVADMLEAGDNK